MRKITNYRTDERCRWLLQNWFRKHPYRKLVLHLNLNKKEPDAFKIEFWIYTN